MSENLKYILTLTLICLVTASLLSGVYFLTKPKILEQKQRVEREALLEVLPKAGYFEPVMREGEVSHFKAYSSSGKRGLLGYAFIARAQGYSSTIETMAGIDTQGEITGIKILAQNETPGLGARIDEVVVKKTLWQRIKEFFRPQEKAPEVFGQPWFCAQFKGKRLTEFKDIQAVTGATISSEALINSVRKRAEEILDYERK